MRKIWLLGDTHGSGHWVNNVQQRAFDAGADCIFQLGDFGVWHGRRGKEFLDMVSNYAEDAGVPFYFLDGNHEDFVRLNDLVRKGEVNEDGHIEIRSNLFYSPRGHKWEWSGKTFMSMGGAISIDKDRRVFGKSWWPEEEITDEQVAKVEEGKVDVLLSHDAPLNPLPKFARTPRFDRMSEPNQDRLRQVFDKVTPEYVFHGHFHYPYQQLWRGARVVGLNIQWTEKSEATLQLPDMEIEVF